MLHKPPVALLALMVIPVLMALGLGGQAWAVEPWPELPLPPRADEQWIAQRMRVDGVPTRVMQFQSKKSRAEIVAYYRSYWSGGYAHPPSVRALGSATVIGQMHGPYLMTVKVEDGDRGESRGLISVAQVIGFKEDRSAGALPLMPGARVLSVVESDDPGKHSRAVSVLNPQPASSASRFYQASLVDAGWHQLQANDVARTAASPAATFLVFANGSSEMQLSIVDSRNGRGSSVLANLVTKDTGSDRK